MKTLLFSTILMFSTVLTFSNTLNAGETKVKKQVQKTEHISIAFFGVQDDCGFGPELDVFDLETRIIPYNNNTLKVQFSNSTECMASKINGHYQCVIELKLTNPKDKKDSIMYQFIYRFRKIPKAIMGILEINIGDKCESTWVILTKPPKGEDV